MTRIISHLDHRLRQLKKTQHINYMNRLIIILAFISGLAYSVVAQDSELRSLETFNEIKVATGIEATIVAGSINQIEITSNGIELEEVISSVKSGQLVVKLKTNLSLWKEKKVDVQAVITYHQELSGIYVNSGASIYSDNTVVSETIELSSASGAHMDIEIMCGDVDAAVSTGAEMKIKGEAKRLDLKFNTGASFNGFKLVTQKAKVKGGTGANAEINVVEYIKTNINTGATLDYKGNPSNKNINKGTGGEVRHRESGS